MILWCSHCGCEAIESKDNMFADGDGEFCMTCGFPGHVSVDEDSAEWVEWAASFDAGVCNDPACDECEREEGRP